MTSFKIIDSYLNYYYLYPNERQIVKASLVLISSLHIPPLVPLTVTCIRPSCCEIPPTSSTVIPKNVQV